MINKVYEQLKSWLRENFKYVFFLIAFYIVLNIPLPYYIHTTGGLIDISDKVTIQKEYDKTGSINLSYVTEMNGNVLSCLLSFVIPKWDLVNKENYVSSNETYEEVVYRNHTLLNEANDNATIVSYKAAAKKLTIQNQHFYVVYVDDKADTTLKIGDEIISVNGTKVNNMKNYNNTVLKSKVGDNLNIVVIDNKKNTVTRIAKVFVYEQRNATGIMVSAKYDYEADPKISFSFKESESGPSGGLMMSIAIYNKLVREDLTKGLKIVGTGTIDVDGNVGQISGIQYKLRGAVDAHADIFLAPLGENYEDAKRLAKENNYGIKIIGVATFDDALNYLRSV